MAIRKATYQFVMLYDDEEIDPGDMSMTDLDNVTSFGSCMGRLVMLQTENVPDVVEAERALGGDGTFFNRED